MAPCSLEEVPLQAGWWPMVSSRGCSTKKELCLPNKELTQKIRSWPLCEPV